jgi:hypothetical protein
MSIATPVETQRCTHCSRPVTRITRGRCGACYMYWLRHGADRPWGDTDGRLVSPLLAWQEDTRRRRLMAEAEAMGLLLVEPGATSSRPCSCPSCHRLLRVECPGQREGVCRGPNGGA